MDLKNVQSATRDGMKDVPQETDIDFENEDKESLKKMGRQVED